MICQTLDSQSRILARPDGALVDSALGARLAHERALATDEGRGHAGDGVAVEVA